MLCGQNKRQKSPCSLKTTISANSSLQLPTYINRMLNLRLTTYSKLRPISILPASAPENFIFSLGLY